jgi:hypothetical protein
MLSVPPLPPTEFAASRKSSLFDKAAGVPDDIRQVEEHSPDAGIAAKYGSDKGATSAANVHDCPEL